MSSFKEAFDQHDKAILGAVGDDALLDGEPVRGKFDAPWLQPDIGTLRTGIREPIFTAQDEVLAAAKKGSEFEIDAKKYDVMNIEPDGSGVTTLVLRPK